MNVGILGLGLIGGSLARAYIKAGHTVFCCDKDESILDFAMLSGVVHSRLTEQTITDCDLILLAIFAQGSAEWLEKNAQYIPKDSLVIDCCGIKEEICNRCFPLAEKYGFTFIGAHPMAGTHNSGFKYAKETMFSGAPMVLVPQPETEPDLLEKVTEMLSPCRFGRYSVTTAEKHDQMIAFTSQMAHVVSNAFIKSPTACVHKGFSAGSYKDLTRVAWLNPSMWTELFLENKDNLINEIDIMVNALNKYKKALKDNDEKYLYELLDEGKKRKEMVDGR